MCFKTILIPALFICLIKSNVLNAQNGNMAGAYSGKIKCKKGQFNARFFMYKADNDIYYMKYQEFSSKKNELLTEMVGSGRFGNKAVSFKIAKVNKSENDKSVIAEFDPANKGRGYVYEYFSVDFPAPDQLHIFLTTSCINTIVEKDASLSKEYESFIQEIQPNLVADKWDEKSFGFGSPVTFALKHRRDADKKDIYLIDGSEWVMFGAYNYNWAFVPYPMDCNNMSTVVLIGNKEGLTSGSSSIAPMTLRSQFEYNYKNCELPGTVTYKVFDSRYGKIERYSSYYSKSPHLFLLDGKAPDPNKTEFVCGGLQSRIVNGGQLVITAPDKNYFKQHNAEFRCLIDSFLSLKRSDLLVQGGDIMVITKAGNEVIQKNILRYANSYRLMPDYDAAVETIPIHERINLFARYMTNPQFLEDIYYGLFAEATEQVSIGVIPTAAFTYYQMHFQNDFADFLSDKAITIPIRYTAQLVKKFGLTQPLKDETYLCKVEPRYAECFSQKVQSIIGIQNLEALLYISGSRPSNIIEDIKSVMDLYNPESRVAYRFKENLHRYVCGMPALKASDPLDYKPAFNIKSTLMKADTINLQTFLRLAQSPMRPMPSEIYDNEARQAGIDGKVLRCMYEVAKDKYYVRYFWCNPVPVALEEKLKQLSPGNSLLTDIGPAVTKAPADLNSALKLLAEYQ